MRIADTRLFCLVVSYAWHGAVVVTPPDMQQCISGVLCQKQVLRGGTRNYIQQYLWDVTTCPCPWYLLLAQHSSLNKHINLIQYQGTWWRHQMETFSALLALCAGNSPVPVNSPHKGQWRGALMFSFICVWINDWVNNREAGDLRRHRGHYDVNVMKSGALFRTRTVVGLFTYEMSSHHHHTNAHYIWMTWFIN